MKRSVFKKIGSYSLRPEILVLQMDKINVSITKISLDTTISRTSISGRRE